MSRFYGSMNGAAPHHGYPHRIDALRHVGAHPRGWDIGARVAIGADGEGDIVDIYATRGLRKER